MSHLNVHGWQFSTGLEAAWRGGPARDADGERTGGYAMMDASLFWAQATLALVLALFDCIMAPILI